MEQEVVTEQSANDTEETSVSENEETAKAEEASTEQSAQEEEGVVEPAPQPRKKTAQERIDEITFARREAERQAEYWRNQALQAQAIKPAETPKPASDRPKLEQFETTEAYEDALIDWKFSKTAEQQRQVAQREAEARAEKDFYEKAQKLKQEYPDYDDVIQAPVYTPVMRQAILDSDNGAVLAYHLALPENRAIANAIAQKPAHLQLVELGKFETQIQMAKTANKKTQAPAPIKPLGSTAGGELHKDTSKMTDEEYYAYDEARRVAEFKQRQARLGG